VDFDSDDGAFAGVDFSAIVIAAFGIVLPIPAGRCAVAADSVLPSGDWVAADVRSRIGICLAVSRGVFSANASVLFAEKYVTEDFSAFGADRDTRLFGGVRSHSANGLLCCPTTEAAPNITRQKALSKVRRVGM
jgi:hypothetical protein